MWRRGIGLGAGLLVLLLVGVVGVRYVTSRPGDLVVRTVTVGRFPSQVVVDAHTGRVFVANGHGSVSMLDAGSGRVLGTIPVASGLGNIVLDGPTDRVFALSDSGTLIGLITVLDGRTGAILRTTPASVLEPIVNQQTGVLVAAAKDPQNGQYDRLAIFDGRSGALLRTAPLDGPNPQVLGLDTRTNHVFAANFATATTSMRNAATGRLLRSIRVGSTPLGVAVDARTERVFVTNNGADTVSVLDAHSATLLYTIKVGPHPARVVVDARTARVFVVHGRGGATGDPYSLPDVEQSGVTMLDARTGAVLRSLLVGGSPVDDVDSATATNIVVDARHSRVFVINQAALDANGLPLNGNGSVSVLDAHSGLLLRTIPVGWNPISLAVDETAARLFVVNANSGCIPRQASISWIPVSLRRWLPFLSAPEKPQCDLPGSVTVVDTSRL